MQSHRPGALTLGWIILFVAVSHCTLAAERWVPYQVVTEDQLDLPKLSPIGKQVLRNPKDWLIGQSEHFLVFTEERYDLQNAVDDAENAFNRAGTWFNLDTESMPRSLLVFVRDGKQWDRLMKGFGLRRDGLSMQLGKELYFRDDPTEPRNPERVSHEVIQLSLNLSFAPRVPLWLDEGIACHFGWICATEMYNKREIAITRTFPIFDEDELYSLEDLLLVRRYPRNERKARVFYRQSEALTAVLAERLNQDDFARFVHIMCDGSDAGVAHFREAAGLANDELDDIVRTVRQRCMQAPDHQ